MIDVQNLTKYYGDYPAVRDVTFHVPKGQIVGFLGPNGAGKSTTLKILTCYLPPTSGGATIATKLRKAIARDGNNQAGLRVDAPDPIINRVGDKSIAGMIYRDMAGRREHGPMAWSHRRWQLARSSGYRRPLPLSTTLLGITGRRHLQIQLLGLANHRQ